MSACSSVLPTGYPFTCLLNECWHIFPIFAVIIFPHFCSAIFDKAVMIPLTFSSVDKPQTAQRPQLHSSTKLASDNCTCLLKLIISNNDPVVLIEVIFQNARIVDRVGQGPYMLSVLTAPGLLALWAVIVTDLLLLLVNNINRLLGNIYQWSKLSLQSPLTKWSTHPLIHGFLEVPMESLFCTAS